MSAAESSCPDCGKANDPAWKTCGVCGATLTPVNPKATGRWRQGGQVKRNVYNHRGDPVCMCLVEDEAAEICAAVNWHRDRLLEATREGAEVPHGPLLTDGYYIVLPEFGLGGAGKCVARTDDELLEGIRDALALSPTHKAFVERKGGDAPLSPNSGLSSEALPVPAASGCPARKALSDLVKQLDAIHADERYRAVWTMYMVHGGNYVGPKYEAELEAARAALAMPCPRDDDGPGTPLHIMNQLFEFAERECGHSPVSSKHALTAVIEAFAGLRAEVSLLRDGRAACEKRLIDLEQKGSQVTAEAEELRKMRDRALSRNAMLRQERDLLEAEVERLRAGVPARLMDAVIDARYPKTPGVARKVLCGVWMEGGSCKLLPGHTGEHKYLNGD